MRRGNLGNMERDMRHDLSAFYLAFAQHFLTTQSWSFWVARCSKVCLRGETYLRVYDTGSGMGSAGVSDDLFRKDEDEPMYIERTSGMKEASKGRR